MKASARDTILGCSAKERQPGAASSGRRPLFYGHGPQLCRVVLGVLCVASGALAAEFEGRWKLVASGFDATNEDIVARSGIDPAYGLNADLRLGYRDSLGKLSWEIAGEITALQGDLVRNQALVPFGANGGSEGALFISDAGRAVDLADIIDRGGRHAISQRVDRAVLAWQRGRVRVRAGRQALSLGGGIVFNPLDVYSPFAPTAVDRDFKTGDDALIITYLGPSGSETELIGVARRRPGEKGLSAAASSFGVRHRRQVGALELELGAARHYDDDLIMASASGPIGGAVWRINWLGTFHKRPDGASTSTHSAVANIDFAFGFRDQAGYAFFEYYYNGFGDPEAAEEPQRLSQPALERLARGELFVLEQHYFAMGTQLGLTPLMNLNAAAIFNLEDQAPLLQAGLVYQPGDNQTLEFGVIVPTGYAGEEFGGITLGQVPADDGAAPLLTGTSRQAYLRHVWFF